MLVVVEYSKEGEKEEVEWMLSEGEFDLLISKCVSMFEIQDRG